MFFLAMTLNPEIQRKAQEEIDRVVGCDRLPNSQDRPSLPYVEAIIKEAFRYHPIVPIDVPHTMASDYEFEGHYLPKGAMVLANLW